MKTISIRISADDEPIGAFTLDPLTTVALMAHARVNKRDIAQDVKELIRLEVSVTTSDEEVDAINDDLDRETMPDENDLLAVALEICSARELAALKITADHRN